MFVEARRKKTKKWKWIFGSVLSFYMTEKAAEQVGIFEAARLWSSEIEYSDENEDVILDTIFEEMQQ